MYANEEVKPFVGHSCHQLGYTKDVIDKYCTHTHVTTTMHMSYKLQACTHPASNTTLLCYIVIVIVAGQALIVSCGNGQMEAVLCLGRFSHGDQTKKKLGCGVEFTTALSQYSLETTSSLNDELFG